MMKQSKRLSGELKPEHKKTTCRTTIQTYVRSSETKIHKQYDITKQNMQNTEKQNNNKKTTTTTTTTPPPPRKKNTHTHTHTQRGPRLAWPQILIVRFQSCDLTLFKNT